MYDCIVVGAGPAGGSAAYHLARQKFAVLVLEKEALPRYKPCGGGVSPVVQQWFDFDFKPAVSLLVNQVRYTWQMADPQLVELGLDEPMWMVRRDIFDHYLIQQAEKLGAVVQPSTEVMGIKWQGDRWQVTVKSHGDSKILTAKFLIAADGARGSMAKWLGFKERKKRMGAALEAEAMVNTNGNATLHFDFGTVNNGYIWNFPKADGYSIGVGTFRGGEDKQNLKEIAKGYAQTFGVDLANIKQYGHPLCLWNGDMPLHTQNAILTGEAACIVDPFTAEGIRPSLYTGMLAGQAIAQSLNGEADALKIYTKKVQAEWGADMAWAQRLGGIFYRIPKFAYNVGIKRPAATKRMGRLLSGEERYRDIADAAIKRLTKGLIPDMS